MIYTYVCQSEDCEKSGVVEEVIKPVAELDRPEPCEVCGKPRWRKVALSSFQLKGTRWAKTKYE